MIEHQSLEAERSRKEEREKWVASNGFRRKVMVEQGVPGGQRPPDEYEKKLAMKRSRTKKKTTEQEAQPQG